MWRRIVLICFCLEDNSRNIRVWIKWFDLNISEVDESKLLNRLSVLISFISPLLLLYIFLWLSNNRMEYDPQELQLVKALDVRLIPMLVTSYWVALLVSKIRLVLTLRYTVHLKWRDRITCFPPQRL